MYPNPQDALPLPARPDVAHYRKLAKDLVKACKAGDVAIQSWAVRWVQNLAAHQQEPDALPDAAIEAAARDVDQFARQTLRDREPSAACALTGAQFVIARAHGFPSWPAFVRHLESLHREDSDVSAFESAAFAVVTGDAATLTRLLRERPGLTRARSTREHRATLLHYVSANGVENYRQKSPKNAADITRMLLSAGADVDAGAEVYGSSCTALGLVATSAPPAIAGVQIEVMDVLLEYGARMDRPGAAGRTHPLPYACLVNGQPRAAEHLMHRGAPLDLAAAAGLGQLDAVARFFGRDGGVEPPAKPGDLLDAFALACIYGQTNVVDYLLDRGVPVDVELKGHGQGHTGLHVAAYHGHLDVVNVLLQRGASVDVIDKTWKTSPLTWALTGWSGKPVEKEARYYEVVARLVAAGATVRQDLLGWERVQADPNMMAALSKKPPLA